MSLSKNDVVVIDVWNWCILTTIILHLLPKLNVILKHTIIRFVITHFDFFYNHSKPPTKI